MFFLRKKRGRAVDGPSLSDLGSDDLGLGHEAERFRCDDVDVLVPDDHEDAEQVRADAGHRVGAQRVGSRGFRVLQLVEPLHFDPAGRGNLRGGNFG
jgi:hypothetical protein